MALPIDEQYDKFVVATMIQHYGDLLKVSRTRGILMTLPKLRKYVKENEYIRVEYDDLIHQEQKGQGLEEHAVLNSLINAQVNAFEKGDHKNNTMYASEIKKLITEGDADRNDDGSIDVAAVRNTGKSLVDEILERPLQVDVTKITNEDATKVREILLASFKKFAMWTFEIQMGTKFQMQDFHEVIFEFCQKIVDGEIDRGIVTIPPRHSKTQTLSISLPLYSFCHNPSSHNIITSYADDVVAESSGYIRQVMLDDLFKKIFPAVRIDPSKRSLERWGTTKSGVMHAVPTGGKMTGKGAGLLSDKYSGVFVVDDAIKPKDAYSNPVRTEINDRYDNTFMSRLANDGFIQDEKGREVKCSRTPIVLIMQRVHDEDLVGYLLRGNSSDKYQWLNIPAIITKECGSRRWYNKIIRKQAYTHAIPYLYDLERGEGESALWSSRKSLKSLQSMRKSTPYTFNSQYMGDPTAKGIGLIQESWWQEYTELDRRSFVKVFMTADTASTAKDYSDYSVICLWGLSRNSNLYLLDVELGKWETPELKKVIKDFWDKHNKFDAAHPNMLPTALYMEDKMSGQFLNQQFMKDGSVRVLPVPRDKSGNDKIARFLNAVPYFAQGRIFMPAEHEHHDHIMREVLNFTGLGSGTGNDDVIDNISDAVVVAYSAGSINYQDWV